MSGRAILKILLLENMKNKTEVPWYWDKINISSKLKVDYYNINETSFLKAIPRLISAFILSFRYDVVVTRQALYSAVIYPLLFRLFRRKKTKLIIEGFQTNEYDNTIRSFIKYRYLQFVLPAASLITCCSRSEILYYENKFKLNKSKFKFIPLAINFSMKKDSTNDCLKAKQSNYIICAGRTGRDYKTFFDAIRGLNIKVIVVADIFNIANLNIPKNVEVKYNITIKELNKLIVGARFCVTSLQDKLISVGQRVCLQYMACAKAQIATNVPAMIDYIKNGETGILTSQGNVEEMRNNIKYLIDNPDVCYVMGDNAKAVIDKFHLIHNFYDVFLRLLKRV